MKSSYTNIRLILEKIRRNPMLKSIPLETIVDYTEDFIRIVGCPCGFIEKTAVVKIDRYRGELPDDFHEIIQAREASTEAAEEYYNENESDGNIMYSVLNRFDLGYGDCVVKITWDSNPLSEEVLYALKDIDFGDYGVICVNVDAKENSSTGADKFNFSSGRRAMRASTDSFHMNGRSYGRSEFTYKIQNHKIYTSEESGYVEIAYRALAIDDDGLPLIPDNSKFTRALEWYIKLQYYTILFETGKMDVRILQNTQQEYAWAVGAYESECHMLTIDEMQSVTNSLNTLFARTTDHDDSFVHMGTRQYIKKQ